MYANPPDDPRERLNYSNGQRLAASDFRAEQGHHDGMRRVLNKALYSSGVVVGLEVELAKSTPLDQADKHRVIVKRGLAFDYLGREIFLPVDVVVQVMGAPSTTPGVVFGNLLTVSYRERRKFPAQEKCTVGAPYKPCSGDLAWGAPTRIAADAVFEFLDSWPADDSGRVVLAQIELNKSCQVESVLPGVRKYALRAKPPTVTPLALEGEKDIDAANPKELIFHVRGGFPAAATLVLRSRQFSSLHYTELARHKHPLLLKLAAMPGQDAHTHPLGDPAKKIVTTDDLDPSSIGFTARAWGKDAGSNAFTLLAGTNPPTGGSHAFSSGDEWDLADSTKLRVTGTKHHHTIDPTQTTGPGGGALEHSPTFEQKDAEEVGHKVGGVGVRAGDAYMYFADLQVEIDGVNVTGQILDQLRASGTDWPTLRLGKLNDSTHVMVTTGTGDIDLLRLSGVDLVPGLHTLKFKPLAGGGQLHYNLYVE